MLDAILRVDEAALGWFAAWHTPALDAVMIGLSRAGRGGLLWLVAGALLALARPRVAGGVVQMALAIGLASLLVNAVVKPAVDRPRPFEAMPGVQAMDLQPASRSFPSGHAANAFAGAYALARLAPVAQIPIWTLAVGVGLSRVYLGVHYPLDVLAGALIGLACSAFVVGGSRWYSVRSAAHTPPVPR